MQLRGEIPSQLRVPPLVDSTGTAHHTVTPQPEDGLARPCRLAEDRFVVHSPLVGIHRGLSASRADLTFVVACDMPFVKPRLVEFLLAQAEGFDVVVPVVRGCHEPLCSAYRETCLDPIDRLITRGILKVTMFYTHVRAHAIPETQVGRLDIHSSARSPISTRPRESVPQRWRPFPDSETRKKTARIVHG